MGVASAAMLLSRSAVAEVQPPKRRGRAISNIVIGGAAGSIAGPLIVGPSGRLPAEAGMNELSGAYLAALVIQLLPRWLPGSGCGPIPAM
jgi:MFS family permease